MAAALIGTSVSRGEEGTFVRRKAEVISRSVGRMNRLIDDLVDFAAVATGRLSIRKTLQSVSALIDESVSTFQDAAAEKAQSLTGGHARAPEAVECDRDRILQVLANLVGNAMKVTPPGGVISIEASAASGGVLFTVADDGPGIAPEHLDRIFERYWQGGSRQKRAGRGLGLAIAKGIVEAHGGIIWAESRLGVGTRVSFTVPLEQDGTRHSDRGRA